MHRIILLFLFFLILPDVYIYFVHIVPKAKKRGRKHLLYWFPTLFLLIAFFSLMLGENAMSHHARLIGYMGVLIILCVVPKTLFMVFSLIGLLFKLLIPSCSRKPFNLVGVMVGVVAFGCIAYGSFVGVERFEVNEVEYCSSRLPDGFDGYRIVQISDIHIGSWQGKEKQIARLVEIINQQKADLIVFTGDLVNQQSRELENFRGILSELEAPDGVYSILGNHDYGDYYRWPSQEAKKNNLTYLKQQQSEMGWNLLNNEHVVLHRQGDSIALIGVENDGEPPFSQHADLPRAVQHSDSLFSILLSHNPTHWRREVLPNTDIDLMLSGHTHAMQSIFFGRSLAELKYPEWRGFYYEGRQALYVNIGIGYVGLPFRLGAWPEITVLTLCKEE